MAAQERKEPEDPVEAIIYSLQGAINTLKNLFKQEDKEETQLASELGGEIPQGGAPAQQQAQPAATTQPAQAPQTQQPQDDQQQSGKQQSGQQKAGTVFPPGYGDSAPENTGDQA